MRLNKLAVALLAVGVSGVASAGSYLPAPCVGENVIVPCEEQGFAFGVDFLYVEPTGSNFTQLGEPIIPGSLTGVGDNLDWAPGVRVEGAYLFGNGNDVTANFSWWQKNSTAGSYEADQIPSIPFAGPIFGLPWEVQFEQESEGQLKVDDRFWDVNLEFGTTAFYGDAVKIRYHAGLKYADIKRDRSQFTRVSGDANFVFLPGLIDFEVFDVPFDASNTHELNSKFQGFGPRVGVDAEYEVMDSGFSLVGKAAVSLLVGDSKTTIKTRTNLIVDGIDIDIPDPADVNLRTRQIVPGTELSLGGKYMFDIPEVGGELGIEGGWQWANYHDAIQVSSFSYQNFGYHGLYLGLQWRGDSPTTWV